MYFHFSTQIAGPLLHHPDADGSVLEQKPMEKREVLCTAEYSVHGTHFAGDRCIRLNQSIGIDPAVPSTFL